MNFSLIFINDIKIALPELFLVTSILVLIIHGVILTVDQKNNYSFINKSISWVSILILLLSSLIILNNPLTSSTFFNNIFINDIMSVYGKQIIIFSTIVCLLTFQHYVEDYQLNSFEYYVLILLVVLSLFLLISSYDLISAYLAIEMQSLSFYVLAAFKRNSIFSTEAGLKYFILGSFSSGLILYGSSLVYGFVGTTNFEHLANIFLETNNKFSDTYDIYILQTAITFLIVGLLFKLSAAPFHMWAPDVYEGAPTSSTIFFSIVPKIGVFILFSRLFQFGFYSFISDWQQFVLFCTFSSLAVGSIVSLKQRKIKRLITYSGISHVGYLLLSFSLCTIEGNQALFVYIITYIITSFCIWSTILSVESQEGNLKSSRNLSDLAALNRSNPILAFTLAMSLFSLAGIPPFIGFYAKIAIFLASIELSMYIITILSLLLSIISSFYYIRIIKIIYFEKTLNWNYYYPVNEEKSIIIGLTLFLIIFLFINPNLLNLLAYKIGIVIFL
jgi:NADH-quinone oxidoreductase subunit N